MTTTGALQLTGSGVVRTRVRRRDLRPDDVAVAVSHCGVCGTDLHAWHRVRSGGEPVVPGHEATGSVVAVGEAVTSLAVGEAVAVGNIVDSCGACAMCRAGQENFCERFPTLTYGGRDRLDGSTTQGLWSGLVVVREAFVHPLPAGLDPAGAAPLLCAGVTVWEPLRALGVGPGTEVAVSGVGGLGHLAVRLAAALGARVTVLTRTAAKAGQARALGAHEVVVSTDEAALATCRGRFDVVLDTAPRAHDPAPLLRLLALDGALCVLGALERLEVDVLDLLVGRKRLTSGGSGGLPATRELLAFCAEHGITAQVEVLPAARAAEALERLQRGDVRYRFVLDTGELAHP
ncbi:NAD(P)-dependent alcohol dehydrogenase [Kineococcus indalonis]|uniref:NAD(P)-dependent alcohol dehydrogenase n=1 Tax=Kineococcus indalonis TaxID=2696566 RepID=UPI0014123C76|nr:NAD(P)-dependent alcohol dehydrogenase [Kineococcus indalonis]NAZ85365.1 alcohol dehydrogenase catalytic domain-containing protein [Kineococcus indalonis]